MFLVLETPKNLYCPRNHGICDVFGRAFKNNSIHSIFRITLEKHTHTCSDLSYRIVMWNATVVQKHQQTKLTR